MNKQRIQALFLATVVLLAFSANAKTINYLNESKKKLSLLPTGNHLQLSYHEKLNELYHSTEPWQELHYLGQGSIWVNADGFYKSDSIINGKRKLYSKTQLKPNELLLLDYGHKEQMAITKSLFAEQLIQTARYSPIPLLAYFAEQNVAQSKESNQQFAVYKTQLQDNSITVTIRKSDFLVLGITVLRNNDLLGDVRSSFRYSDYTSFNQMMFPKTIKVDKINGRINDEIIVDSVAVVEHIPRLLEKPLDYTIAEDVEAKPEIRTENYSPNIHFADLLHTGSKVMIVEFKDFLLVAEAPLNSSNGELVIQEAQKIAPGKPIRYFTFGHHHPDYIGGMRAFVHKETIILSVKEDHDYLRYLARAPHTLKPDSLELSPHAIKLQELRDSTTITDADYEMKIYVIGEKSGHTKDYTVYYFPKEKLLVEGDLIWIDKNKPLNKASKMQAGVYQAIVDLGLAVDTIIQTWGIQYNSIKSQISFEELKATVEMK